MRERRLEENRELSEASSEELPLTSDGNIGLQNDSFWTPVIIRSDDVS